jgi:hypothetical protein
MKFVLSCLCAAAILGGCAAPGGPGVHYPTLTDDKFAAMHYGMTRDDARRILGSPVETMKFPLSATESWSYRYFDTWGYLVDYSLTFAADGTLVGKLPVRLNDGGNHGG